MQYIQSNAQKEFCGRHLPLDTIQDFLIKLSIKLDASMGNQHFSTKSCHRQTYQTYEQSQQKLGNFTLFEKVDHNLGRSDNGMI